MKDDKLSVFTMPVLAAFIEFEGKKGLSFQGLKNTVIQTMYKITTENLNKDNVPKLSKEHMIENARLKIANDHTKPSKKKEGNLETLVVDLTWTLLLLR